MKKVLVTGFILFLQGCYIYQPELTERHKALQLIDEGVVMLRQGDLEEAEATFEAAYEIGRFAAALDGLGSVAMLRGEHERAERLFRTAYAVDPSYANALGNLALLKEQQGNLEVANQLYLQALAQDPSNYKIRGNFSVFLAEYKGESTFYAKRELLKAWVVGRSPLLRHNQDQINRSDPFNKGDSHGEESKDS